MTSRRLQFGAAVIDNKLYVVGGRDGLKTLNIVECYDFKTKTWTGMPSMSTHRHGLGILTFLWHLNFFNNIIDIPYYEFQRKFNLHIIKKKTIQIYKINLTENKIIILYWKL